eukprot:scaffold388742_cov34-Prasinocladus_malaysianus.AAC.1
MESITNYIRRNSFIGCDGLDAVAKGWVFTLDNHGFDGQNGSFFAASARCVAPVDIRTRASRLKKSEEEEEQMERAESEDVTEPLSGEELVQVCAREDDRPDCFLVDGCVDGVWPAHQHGRRRGRQCILRNKLHQSVPNLFS